MNPWLSAFFGFAVGTISGIAFVIFLLIRSHKASIAMLTTQPKGK